MPHNRLPRVMKHYSPRRNHGRPLKRLLDAWDRNRSTSGPTPWQIYDDDDDNNNQCHQKNLGQLHNTLWERVLCGTFSMHVIISIWAEYINCSYQICNNKTCLILTNVIFWPVQVLECKLNQLLVQGPVKDHKYVLPIAIFILRWTTPHSFLVFFVSFWSLRNTVFFDR
jgi:hypothetical protein